MERLAKWTMFGCLLCLFRPEAARSEGQFWAQFLSQGKLSSDLRLWLEGQPRYGFTTGGFTTVLLRPGLGWQVSPVLSLWLGYAYTPLIRPSARDEHRLWLQGIHTLALGDDTLIQRLRLERRSVDTVADSAVRLRYQARFVTPLREDKRLGLVLYDEIFFNLNTAGAAFLSGFDQNRLFAGLNYRFSPALAFDLGYLWNAVNRPPPGPNQSNHVLLISLFHNFSLVD